MTLTLELSPHLEDRLRAAAARNGLDPAAYVQQLLDRDLSDGAAEDHSPGTTPQSLWERLSPEEWQRVTHAWIESHNDWPDIPDEALTRESFYKDGE